MAVKCLSVEASPRLGSPLPDEVNALPRGTISLFVQVEAPGNALSQFQSSVLVSLDETADIIAKLSVPFLPLVLSKAANLVQTRPTTTLAPSLWQLYRASRIRSTAMSTRRCPADIWLFCGFPFMRRQAGLETSLATTANGRKKLDPKTAIVAPYGHWGRYFAIRKSRLALLDRRRRLSGLLTTSIGMRKREDWSVLLSSGANWGEFGMP
jgi:hypothetical protein